MQTEQPKIVDIVVQAKVECLCHLENKPVCFLCEKTGYYFKDISIMDAMKMIVSPGTVRDDGTWVNTYCPFPKHMKLN